MKNTIITHKRCFLHNQETLYVNLHKEDVNFLKYQCEFCDHHNSIKIDEAVHKLFNEPKIMEQQRIEGVLQQLMDKVSKFKTYVEQCFQQITAQYQISQRLNKIYTQILKLKNLEVLSNEHIDEVCSILVNEDLKKIPIFKEETLRYLQQLSITFQEVEQVLRTNQKVNVPQKQLIQVQNQLPMKIQEEKQMPNHQGKFENQIKLQQSVIIYAMAFSFDDSKLVVGGGNINHLSENKNLMVITLTDRKEQFLYGHTRRVTAIQYSKHSNFFVSGSLDFTLRLWNINDNGVDWECIQLLNSHTSTVFGICLDIDENQIFSCSYDTTIIVWEKQLQSWNKNQVLLGHRSSVNALCLSEDNTTLATGSDDTQVILWQKDLDQQWVVKQTITNEDMSYIYSLCFFKDNTLAVGTHGGQIAIWKQIISNYKLLHEIKPQCGYVKKIAYNASEQLLVTKCEHKTIIWKIDQTDYLQSIQEYKGEYLGVAVSKLMVALFNCDNHMLEIVKYNK